MILIRGNNLSNVLDGTDDEEFFMGFGGNDVIHGGGGIDVARYAGGVAGYRFSSVAGKLVIEDIAAADGQEGKDSLDGIETLQFGNAQLSVTGTEFRINTTQANDQDFVKVAAFANGGFVAVWRHETDDGDLLIMGQRFDAAGNKLGTEFRVDQSTDILKEPSSVTVLSNGGFLVAWTTQDQDGDGAGVEARFFDAQGNAVGDEFQVNETSASQQANLVVQPLQGGGVIAAWNSLGQDGDGVGIVARIIYSAEDMWPEFNANWFTTGNQYSPDVAVLADGKFVITWTSDQAQDGDETGVYGRLFTKEGIQIAEEFQVNATTTGFQESSAVAALAGGGFVIAWQDMNLTTVNSKILIQRYDAGGNRIGTEEQVNAFDFWHQERPDVAALADGGFVVTWASDKQDGPDYGIYAQRYDAEGEKLGSEFRVNSFTSGTQQAPSVTAQADGGFVIAWHSPFQDDDASLGVFGQRYDAGGNPVGLALSGTNAADTINLGDGQPLAVNAGAGSDIVNGAGADDNIKGGTGNDTLGGGAGNDLLDGGTGNDRMTGGIGDDTYVVDSAADVVVEAAGGGNDLVRSSVNFTLAPTAEDLELTGTGNINGTGNANGNYIAGNDGNNVLNGGAGADVLVGGKGNDTYFVDNLFDFVFEDENAGDNDRVESSVSIQLADNVENLTLTGVAAIDGFGNDLVNNMAGNAAANGLSGAGGDDLINGQGGNDFIFGGAGADVLTGGLGNDELFGEDGVDVLFGGAGNDNLSGDTGDDELLGGAGNDVLTGGGGEDMFFFNSALSASTNVDQILDFETGIDSIRLSKAFFAALGLENQELDSNAFQVGPAALQADDRIIYDIATGNLFYDSNGSGAGGSVLFAKLGNGGDTLASDDIIVIA